MLYPALLENIVDNMAKQKINKEIYNLALKF